MKEEIAIITEVHRICGKCFEENNRIVPMVKIENGNMIMHNHERMNGCEGFGGQT